VALLASGKRSEAWKQFEAAISTAPGFADPLAQMVSMKLADRDAAGAGALVQRQLEAAPRSPALHELLGSVSVAQGKPEAAEQAFLKAIELDPRSTGAYTSLASIYASRGDFEQAIAKLNEAHRLAPRHPTPLMMLGAVHTRRGDIARAQDAYEKILAFNPRFAPAVNNLAWLHSEHNGDRDKALRLAQLAKEVAPDDPRISDTLGWILYKRGVFQRALPLLEESADKLPEEPTVQYHLGMTYLKVGNKAAARKALTVAIGLKRDFADLPEAKRVLSELD
jgi:Flp pilus assembly protein TadD